MQKLNFILLIYDHPKDTLTNPYFIVKLYSTAIFSLLIELIFYRIFEHCYNYNKKRIHFYNMSIGFKVQESKYSFYDESDEIKMLTSFYVW